MLNRTTPPYRFAVTDKVTQQLPAELDGKQLQASDFIPTRAHVMDTGYDVRCAASGVEIKPGAYVKIPLGIRMLAPDGWWLSVAPRSSTFITHHIHPLYGVVDCGYENELCFVGQFLPDQQKLLNADFTLKIAFGQRIAQVIPCPRWDMPDTLASSVSNEEFERLCLERNAARGTGFGSSGRA